MSDSPRNGAGIGLRPISATHSVDAARSAAMSPYVAATPTTAIAIPPAAGPTIAPPCDTLLAQETPLAVSSSGMTWASNAVSAGRSKPLATPVAKTTARIAGSPIPAGWPTGRPAARRRP